MRCASAAWRAASSRLKTQTPSKQRIRNKLLRHATTIPLFPHAHGHALMQHPRTDACTHTHARMKHTRTHACARVHVHTCIAHRACARAGYHVYTQSCAHRHALEDRNTHARTRMRAHTNAYARTHVHMHTCARQHAHTHVCAQACARIHVHTRTHTYARMRTNSRTY